MMNKNFASSLRLNIILIIFLIITLLTIYQYFILMFSKNMQHFPQKINHISRRGNIYDRNGKIIAFSSKSYSVGTDPRKIKNIVNTSETLGAILKIDPQTIKQKLLSKKGFQYIKRQITKEESELIKRIQSEGRLKDIILYPDYKRIYPFKELTSNITGFVGIDNIGLTGIEFSLNSILNEDFTKQQSINDKLSTNNIYLTIDIDLQNNINQIAKKYFQENKPENMITIVMDAKNGEILSMLQFPQYDANYYSQYSKEIWNNFSTSLTYEPGSINKIFTVAILLDSGLLKPNEKFLDNGIYQKKFKSGETIIIKTLNPPYDYIDLSGILLYSSNVGIAHITDKINNEYFYNKLIDFGFGERVGFPFPGETKGILNHHSKWSGRSKATIGFGQEIGVSAIQILQAASVLSNKGIMLKPKIIKKIINEMQDTIQEFPKEEIKKVISEHTAQKVLKLMREVVNKGGIPKLKTKNLSISAKSGTSQVIDQNTGKYSNEDYTSSILVIYPTEDPKYIIYVVYRYPKKIIYGTRIAAPMAKEIINLIEQKNNKEEYNKIKISSKISIPKPIIKHNIKETLPNLKGLSKRDLMKILKDYINIKINIKGNGFVYKQSHSPNTKLKDIKELEIILQ
ncbi:Division specific D,D-transpeptidase [Borrelia duttonii CR2A]|uniref:Division specific D,D-transpeptidase n=3 Tax=Borrelia duttonii TaxID=40834 RepID=W6THX0_9SPIR|nr:penicillin-binding protein [Borrelia duttonii Ly]ETZ18190.1 Division specific D,D-transpeptidase [Borrelia duttonii CR2A]